MNNVNGISYKRNGYVRQTGCRFSLPGEVNCPQSDPKESRAQVPRVRDSFMRCITDYKLYM